MNNINNINQNIPALLNPQPSKLPEIALKVTAVAAAALALGAATAFVVGVSLPTVALILSASVITFAIHALGTYLLMNAKPQPNAADIERNSPRNEAEIEALHQKIQELEEANRQSNINGKRRLSEEEEGSADPRSSLPTRTGSASSSSSNSGKDPASDSEELDPKPINQDEFEEPFRTNSKDIPEIPSFTKLARNNIDALKEKLNKFKDELESSTEVADLTKKLNDYKNNLTDSIEVADLTENLKKFKTQVIKLEKKLANLKEMAQLTNELNELKPKSEDLKQKKISVVATKKEKETEFKKFKSATLKEFLHYLTTLDAIKQKEQELKKIEKGIELLEDCKPKLEASLEEEAPFEYKDDSYKNKESKIQLLDKISRLLNNGKAKENSTKADIDEKQKIVNGYNTDAAFMANFENYNNLKSTIAVTEQEINNLYNAQEDCKKKIEENERKLEKLKNPNSKTLKKKEEGKFNALRDIAAAKKNRQLIDDLMELGIEDTTFDVSQSKGKAPTELEKPILKSTTQASGQTGSSPSDGGSSLAQAVLKRGNAMNKDNDNTDPSEWDS